MSEHQNSHRHDKRLHILVVSCENETPGSSTIAHICRLNAASENETYKHGRKHFT